jgi:hypothetical protein
MLAKLDNQACGMSLKQKRSGLFSELLAFSGGLCASFALLSSARDSAKRGLPTPKKGIGVYQNKSA